MNFLKKISFLCLWIIAWLLACQIDLTRSVHPVFAQKNAEGALAFFIGGAQGVLHGYFLNKSDAYVHAGHYPGFIERIQVQIFKKQGLTFEDNPNYIDHADERLMPTQKDWIAKMNARRKPFEHIHLTAGEDGLAKEIMPWLRMALWADPHHVETALIAAYWLNKLEKPHQASKVLLDALLKNPNDPELLDALGYHQLRSLQKPEMSLPKLKRALAAWQSEEALKAEPNLFLLRQIHLHLAENYARLSMPEQMNEHLHAVKNLPL